MGNRCCAEAVLRRAHGLLPWPGPCCLHRSHEREPRNAGRVSCFSNLAPVFPPPPFPLSSYTFTVDGATYNYVIDGRFAFLAVSDEG